MATRTAPALLAAMLLLTPLPLLGAEGVRVHLLDEPLTAGTSLDEASVREFPSDGLPAEPEGHPVLASSTLAVSFESGGRLGMWVHHQGRLVRRAEIGLSDGAGPASFRLVAGPEGSPAVEVRLGAAPPVLAALSGSGILRLEQMGERTAVVSCPLSYVLVPSLIGTDLVCDPARLPPGESAWLPSLGMAVGLARGGDGMLVACWPEGDQIVRVDVDTNEDPRGLESLALETDGKPLYLAWLDHEAIWHEEPLRDEYLETDTAIAWRRPFDAHWIGRFTIESDDYSYPFYFLESKLKLWGRYIRGWFYYPVWFDGQRTMVHFEKKFPPRGSMLIYFLDRDPADDGLLSPVAVMKAALGEEEAEGILDLAGIREQVLLEHRHAVCEMTGEIENYCDGLEEALPWPVIARYTDDVATFIRLIRDRIFQFDRFAAETEQWLGKAAADEPELRESLVGCREILAEIRDIAENDLPKVPLEEVRGWTEGMKMLAADRSEKNARLVKGLGQHCRSVAGTQDDMARDLSVAVIRLMEEAARMGTASPGRARLAEEIIHRSRAVLREPTWWEPCRKVEPKSDPGLP